MKPAVSVITPSARGVKELDYLTNDFRNQTFKTFEHIIVFDGTPPDDVVALIEERKKDYNLVFTTIDKDPGNMSMAPGTRPRNHGIKMAKGDYVVFCDDDDRYKDIFLERLVTGLAAEGDTVNVVQMSCQESRMYKNGSPDRIVLVPEVGLPTFPMICHVGTPCFIVKKEWAIEDPWQEEPEHDFRFILRIMKKHNPKVRLISGMLVDVDGLVIKGMRDWVSHPPFFRSTPYETSQ